MGIATVSELGGYVVVFIVPQFLLEILYKQLAKKSF